MLAGMPQRKISPALIAAILALHTVVTAFTWRDIRNRPDDQIRGSKKLWRLVSAANTGNSIIYFVLGRKRVKLPDGV
jgi:hypothetical protein